MRRLDQLPQSDTVCDMPTMTMRIDRRKVNDAKTILAGMGLTPRAAIDVFLSKVISQKAIPFPLAMADSEYARSEYGATAEELAGFDRRMNRVVAAEKKRGTLRGVSGIASLRE
jgi:addiction module RelB/DinJ family antitoxin